MVRRLTAPKQAEPLVDCGGLVLNIQRVGLNSISRLSRLVNSVPRPALCTAMEDSVLDIEVPDSTKLTVGSTVRAPLPGHPKARRRAIIATMQEEEGTVCVFWEDEAPSSLLSNDATMVVSPSPSENDDRPDVETTVAIKEIKPLLDFELAPFESASVNTWKDRGDTLLRLGDASSAVPQYERALNQLGSSPNKIVVGGVAIIKEKGFFKLVQIDCIDEDEVDVTFLDTEEEATLYLSDIMLAIPKRDGGLLQERILLNLARCFLQLAETTLIARRRPSYLKAAVRASSFALSVGEFRDSLSMGTGSSATPTLAHLLRSRAQMGLGKFPHAVGDAKKALALDPKNNEAAKLLREIARKQQAIAKADKKLVKEVCQWVQSATTNEGSVSDDKEDVNTNKEPGQPMPQTMGVVPPSLSTSHDRSLLWLLPFAFLLFSWVVQKVLTHPNKK